MNPRLIFLFVPLVAATPLIAGDWPMWRFNAARQAAAPDDLPADLELHWVRDLPQPMPAWPNEGRLHFDTSIEPVVLGQRIFIGSTVDGSLTAYDTHTGSEMWRFYTNGPVRLAPVAAGGRVYVTSDDGHLYALDAATGKELWKVSGAPESRRQRFHLGNNRLISFWPARGGPAIADNVVYFGAGIWPSMGTFIIAANAETGKVIWRNTRSNYLKNVRIDHNVLHESGISPQGHFLVSGDRLLVTNGRSMPASFKRQSGKLEYFVQGYRRGDCRVSLSEKFIFVGFAGVLNINDGREVGNRWVEAGKEAPDGWNFAKLALFEGPLSPYKFIKACNYRSVVDANMMYGIDQGAVHAYDLKKVKETIYESKFAGRELKPKKWEVELAWKFPTPEAAKKPASYFMIKAGNSLFSHNVRKLFRVALPEEDTKPRITWTASLDAAPSSLLAADDRLFAVTSSGKLYCFGQGKQEKKVHQLEKKELAEQKDAAATAGQILKKTGATEGYCLVLGLENGGLVKEILRQSKMKVIAIDSNSQKVNALRSELMLLGLYGQRAEALTGVPFEFPLPPYIANLIVTEKMGELNWRQIFQSLRPYGGAACFPIAAKSPAALPDATITKSDPYLICRRDGPLPDSATWTHETGNAARTYFSDDRLVRAPLGVLWYGDGPDHGFYKRKDYGSGVKPQVVGGRMFAFQIMSRTMHAIDVYTGRLIWKQKVESVTRYASMTDGVYVAGADKCIVYDSTSGKPIREYQIDIGDTGDKKVGVSDIRVSEELVVIAIDFDKTRSLKNGLWNATALVAFDRKSGKQLWSKPAQQRFNINSVAVGSKYVFCTDSANPSASAETERRGEEPSTISTIMSLNSRTGKEVWQVQIDTGKQAWGEGNWIGMRSRDDSLVYVEGQGIVLAGKNKLLIALNAKTGKEIWRTDYGGEAPLLVRGEQFLNQRGHVFETRTGKILSGKDLIGARGGCNYVVGNPNLLFLRNRTASYIDVKTGETHFLRNLRTGCSNSLVAADGILNVPCFSVGCICNYPIQTSFAMHHMPEVAEWSGAEPVDLRQLDKQ
ncbi:MAG: PQQ-binding-like beta-propeller repeat protein [Planctomycetota bacterium]|jgi:outer membrane protein assembly factor BamB|nr:PQQ-binding-like beta-propeller repeat protein [Planctomycetota bacterium]